MTFPSGTAAYASGGHGANAGTGVLLSHGFTGSPVSVAAWGRYLSDRARTPWEHWYAPYPRANLERE